MSLPRTARTWLLPGQELTFSGPSLFKDLGPPLPYPQSPEPECVQPARQLHEALFASDAPANSSTPWIFRLRDLDNGGISCIQTWNGWVRKKGTEKEYDVSMNLSLPRMLPNFSVEQAADHLNTPGMFLEKEAGFFHTYRKLQGMELDINYGLFLIDIPGERHKCSMTLMERTTHLESDNSLNLLNQKSKEKASITMEGLHGPRSFTPTVFAAMMRTYKRLQLRFLACEPTLLPSFVPLCPLDASTTTDLHILIMPPKTVRYYEDSKKMVREVLRNHPVAKGLNVRSRRKIYEQRIEDLLLCVQMKTPQAQLMETWTYLESLKAKHGLSW